MWEDGDEGRRNTTADLSPVSVSVGDMQVCRQTPRGRSHEQEKNMAMGLEFHGKNHQREELRVRDTFLHQRRVDRKTTREAGTGFCCWLTGRCSPHTGSSSHVVNCGDDDGDDKKHGVWSCWRLEAIGGQ